MTAASLRQFFLDYFKRHGHTVVKSSPLVPANDPTLMFVNAGMVQFKDVFVGAEARPYKRAVSVQKCMRVSGKHNDLEEVGRTKRHHTFFEMLGNFSFGDYFKEEAITCAWDLVTKELGLNRDKLWITVFGGADGLPADNEARTLWRKIAGLPDSRILDKGMKDNFWTMGDSGPCGPCTEIHYDQGEGPVHEADFDSGRVMEIWNNVFMQFDRQAGQLTPLPAPSVDTGMGLERLVALCQGVDSNYHSDLFMPLLESIASAVGKPYQKSPSEDDVSMRVIADHARAAAFLVADGIQPSNEGRGYVMRRIMRRAIRHGKRLGFNDLFLHDACAGVVSTMGNAYPELREAASLIHKVAQLEEEGFRRTLDTGLRILSDEVASLRQGGRKELPGDLVFKLYDTYGFPKDLTEVIAQEQAMQVDNAGFERAMQEQKERSRGADVGQAAVAAVYKQLAQEHAAAEFTGYPHEDLPLTQRPGSWKQLEVEGHTYLLTEVTVQALVQDGKAVRSLTHPGQAEVLLTPTPFYGESGGQAGDTGILVRDGKRVATVQDTQKPVENLVVSRLEIKTIGLDLKVGDRLWAGYDPTVRKQTRAHHSATHLLHGALRRVLGEHVKQAGSFVGPERLRFDFAHFASLTAAEIQAVETDVNTRIANKHPVQTEELSFDAAKKKGAIALFGEKYGDVVRVLTMGDSVEFCGGTHANNTGDLELLLISREESVQSGVRRIEAEVGHAARRTVQQLAKRLGQAAELLQGGNVPSEDPTLGALAKAVRTVHAAVAQVRELKGTPQPFDAAALKIAAPTLPENFNLAQAVEIRNAWQALVHLTNARPSEAAALLEKLGVKDPGHVLHGYVTLVQAQRDNDKELEKFARGARANLADELMNQLREVKGIKLLTCKVHNVDGGALRELGDSLRSKIPSGVLVIGSITGEGDGAKVALLVTVSKDLTGKIKAGDLVKTLAPLVGGRGGGKPEMAQAGGTQPAGLDEALSKVESLL